MPKQLIIPKEDQYTEKICYYDTYGDYWTLKFFDIGYLNLSKNFTELKTEILEKIYYKIYDTDAINMTREDLIEKVTPYITFL